jgi:hypothetical protein
MTKIVTRAMKFVSTFGTAAKFSKATGTVIKSGPKLDAAVRRAMVDKPPRKTLSAEEKVKLKDIRIANPDFEAKHPRKPAGTEAGGEFTSGYTVTRGADGRRIFTMRKK